MPELPQRQRLDQPRRSRRLSLDFDPEMLGRFSERVARFFGTGKFLMWMTVVVVTWVLVNLFAVGLRWDPYPFILLNLAFSTQASYSAPLILLAQNRQDDRDRVQIEHDRQRAERNLADTEYLAREIVALRMSLEERNSQAVTRDVLRQELKALLAELEDAPDKTRPGTAS